MNHPLISALCAATVTLTAGDLTSAPVNPVPSVAAAGDAFAADDGTGFAGAYAPSKHWQPPKDPPALAKLRKFQNLKFGFFFCWGTQTQWETIDQSWSLCPERYDWNKHPATHAGDPRPPRHGGRRPSHRCALRRGVDSKDYAWQT